MDNAGVGTDYNGVNITMANSAAITTVPMYFAVEYRNGETIIHEYEDEYYHIINNNAVITVDTNRDEYNPIVEIENADTVVKYMDIEGEVHSLINPDIDSDGNYTYVVAGNGFVKHYGRIRNNRMENGAENIKVACDVLHGDEVSTVGWVNLSKKDIIIPEIDSAKSIYNMHYYQVYVPTTNASSMNIPVKRDAIPVSANTLSQLSVYQISPQIGHYSHSLAIDAKTMQYVTTPITTEDLKTIENRYVFVGAGDTVDYYKNLARTFNDGTNINVISYGSHVHHCSMDENGAGECNILNKYYVNGDDSEFGNLNIGGVNIYAYVNDNNIIAMEPDFTPVTDDYHIRSDYLGVLVITTDFQVVDYCDSYNTELALSCGQFVRIDAKDINNNKVHINVESGTISENITAYGNMLRDLKYHVNKNNLLSDLNLYTIQYTQTLDGEHIKTPQTNTFNNEQCVIYNAGVLLDNGMRYAAQIANLITGIDHPIKVVAVDSNTEDYSIFRFDLHPEFKFTLLYVHMNVEEAAEFSHERNKRVRIDDEDIPKIVNIHISELTTYSQNNTLVGNLVPEPVMFVAKFTINYNDNTTRTIRAALCDIPVPEFYDRDLRVGAITSHDVSYFTVNMSELNLSASSCKIQLLRIKEEGAHWYYEIIDSANTPGNSTVYCIPADYVNIYDNERVVSVETYDYKLPYDLNTEFAINIPESKPLTNIPNNYVAETTNHAGSDTERYMTKYNYIGVRTSLVDDMVILHKFRTTNQTFEQAVIGNDSDIWTQLESVGTTSATVIGYYRKYDNPCCIKLNSIKQLNHEQIDIENNIIPVDSIYDVSTTFDANKQYHMRNIVVGYQSSMGSADNINIYNYTTNIKSDDANIVKSCINVVDDRMSSVGIGYVSNNVNDFTEYIVKYSYNIDADKNIYYASTNADLLTNLNTNNVFETERKNEYQYISNVVGYSGTKQMYMKFGFRTYDPRVSGNKMQYEHNYQAIGLTGTDDKTKLFAFSLYDNKVNSRSDIYKPRVSVSSVHRNNDASVFGLNKSIATRMTPMKHNTDIFPANITNVYDESVVGEIMNPAAIVNIRYESGYWLFENTAVYVTKDGSDDGNGNEVVVELDPSATKYTLVRVVGTVFDITVDGKQETVHIRNAGGNPWKNKAFRIACGDYANTYKINIYDNEDVNATKTYDELTFYYNSRPFRILAENAESNGTRLPVFHTFMNTLCVTTGTVSSADLKHSHNSNVNNLIDDSSVSEKIITTIDVREQKELLYDTYFNDLVNNSIFNKDAIELVNSGADNRVGLNFVFDCIPVSVNHVVYSQRESFLDLIEQPNFDTDYATVKLPSVVNYNRGKYEIARESYKLNEYRKIYRTTDDYYSNFTRDGDVMEKLGFNPYKIEINKNTTIGLQNSANMDTVDDESVIEPVYFIKGKYYSEQLYTGPVLCPRETNFVYHKPIVVGEKAATKMVSYNIKQGENVLESIRDEEVLNEYVMKRTHYAENGINLTIPKTIDVNITQNEDVEKCLNANPVRINNGSIGSYDVVRSHEPVYGGLQQRIEINKTIKLPNNMDAESNDMYVYLSAKDVRYPLMPNVCTLRVEYM
jgi:hypothetical protein